MDYDLHEVIEVMDTALPEQDRRIADVYHVGYLYQGKVRTKAKVAVYAFGNTDRRTEHTTKKKKEMDMGTVIGIDLGTSTTEAAVICDGKPVMVLNPEKEIITPSAVGPGFQW